MTKPIRLAAQLTPGGVAEIERSVAVTEPFSTGSDRRRADQFRQAGVTLFTPEISPIHGHYDFEPLEQAVAWRDGDQTRL